MTDKQFKAIEQYFMALINADDSCEDALLLMKLRKEVLALLRKAQEK